MLVSRTGFCDGSIRGVNVIASALQEKGFDVDFIHPVFGKKLLNPCFYRDWFFGSGNGKGFVYPEFFNRGSFTENLGSCFFRFNYWLRMIQFSDIDLDSYDLFMVESGEGILNVDLLPGDRLVYRQSDPVELVLSKSNKSFVDIEHRIIKKARLTLVANNKILGFYKKHYSDLTGRMKVWRNGFYIPEVEGGSPYRSGSVNGIYVGVKGIDWGLVRKLAVCFPGIDFYFVGIDRCPVELDNVFCMGFLSYRDWLRYVKYASFVFLPYKKTDRYDYSFESIPSSKNLVFMYYGLPVFVTGYGRLKDYQKYGFIVSDGSKGFVENVGLFKKYGFRRLVYSFDFSRYMLKSRKEELDRYIGEIFGS